MWRGSINFGLVNIPVKLHAAIESKDIKLRQLHRTCQNPINYQKYCAICKREVSKNEIVKAYEYSDNKFVLLDEEELESLRKESEEKIVEIVQFVKMEEIDPIYFERSYFLAPDTNGQKAYTLIKEALMKSGKIGIAKITIRSKEQLAIIRVYQDMLLLSTIHFPNEVRKVEDIPNIPNGKKINKNELEMALLLINQLSGTFDPNNYKNNYREALLKLAEQKRTGKTTAIPRTKKSTIPVQIPDLVTALEASLEKVEKKEIDLKNPKNGIQRKEDA